MKQESKFILGLTGNKIVQKPNKYFTEKEKHQIIQELLSSGCTKAEPLETTKKFRLSLLLNLEEPSAIFKTMLIEARLSWSLITLSKWFLPSNMITFFAKSFDFAYT